jgi:hypothetical protein
MELWEAFNGKTMRQPNVQANLPMRPKPPKVEPKVWGNNVIRVTPIDLQHREQGRIEMSLSTQRHGNLYRSKEILHMHQQVHGGMETRSTYKSFA